jgi:tRNA-binding EMAP/Myf-like protein
MESFCATCDSVQGVERHEENLDIVYCLSCGDEFPFLTEVTKAERSPYEHFRIARVLSVEPILKQKELKKVMVDIHGTGDIDAAVQIVTNAKYVDVGWIVVVALENAVVPAGASLEDDIDVVCVKPCAVGGIMSHGMLCDSPMLSWTGGAKGAIQQLPEGFIVGDMPPPCRPRA